MAQEGALRLSVVIKLGPCWCKVKLNWANITNGSSTIRCWQLENALILMLYIVRNYVCSCIAQLKLYWSSYILEHLVEVKNLVKNPNCSMKLLVQFSVCECRYNVVTCRKRSSCSFLLESAKFGSESIPVSLVITCTYTST